jgi:signal transduction histidine kinase/CheY-like chemotaxis protein
MKVLLGENIAWIVALSCAVFCSCAAANAARCRAAADALRDDLNRQKEDTERQIERSKEAVRAKSDFLSKMSHEIRTPLNAVIGMAKIAQNAATLDKARESIAKVEDSSKHLLGIVNDILDFSKIEAGSLVLDEITFSLRDDMEFVTDMLQVKAEEKNIDLRLEIGEIAHDGIKSDMLRLNQVLINLLSNAVKFTEEEGTVLLRVDELVHMKGESVYRFVVQDNGIGIAPEQAKNLFTPFTQANAGISRIYGGTGLGLVISQSIVRMMGGEVELETEPGKGSAFHFTIRVPAQERVETRDSRSETTAMPANVKGKSVMIVDDIEINRDVVAGLLDGSGVILDYAANGREAADKFLASDENRYDLILMDMQMPVMDGIEATGRIRASGRSDAGRVKIVAMTANVMREDVDRAREAGMDDYVTKPVDVGVLYRVMGDLL